MMNLHPNKVLLRKYKKRLRKIMRSNPKLFKGCRDRNSFWRKDFSGYFNPYTEAINKADKDFLDSIHYVYDNPEYDFTGYYLTDLNPHIDLPEMSNYRMGEYYEEMDAGMFGLYGVSDNATQIYEYLKDKDIPKNCIVTMTPIFKSSEPEYCGWRWHKWGPYIGIKTPTCEYIHDEENIDYVYVWSVHLIVHK